MVRCPLFLFLPDCNRPVQPLARRILSSPKNPWPDPPIPVALVITELDVGGAEKALVSLAIGLNKSRWAPRVFALGPEGPLAEPLRAAGVKVDCLDIHPRRPVRALRTLRAALRSHQPALIQSFLFHANIAARLAARFAGRPVVLSGIRVAERQQRWHLRLDRLTFKLCDGAVCVSEGVRRFSSLEGGWPDDRLVVIPNGVDVTLIDRARATPRESLGIPSEAFMTLFVGRLNVQKGINILLDAVESILPQRPAFHLALAGDGPERQYLTDRLAATPALAAHVHPLGPRGDVPSLLKTADLFVLASIWEGMPNALLEAMAARLAAVATRVEGTEDLVIPGETGWLIPPADSESLATALLEATTDKDRLRRMGEAARSRVEASYTPTRVVEAYERLWGGLLGFD